MDSQKKEQVIDSSSSFDTAQNGNTLNIIDIVFMLLGKIWIIALVAVVCGVGTYLYAHFTTVPMYRSESTIYIKAKSTDPDYTDKTLSSAEMSAATMLAKDYELLITSRTVIDEVLNNLSDTDAIDTAYLSVGKLASRISISNPTGTRMLEISVSDESPTRAQTLVNMVCDVAAVKIVEKLGIDQVNVIDSGNLPVAPYNNKSISTAAIAAVIGIVITCGIIILINYLDDKITSPDDVERYLKLSVLGSIPDTQLADKAVEKKKKHRNKHSGHSSRSASSSSNSLSAAHSSAEGK